MNAARAAYYAVGAALAALGLWIVYLIWLPLLAFSAFGALVLGFNRLWDRSIEREAAERIKNRKRG